jgi:hypothetical protein
MIDRIIEIGRRYGMEINAERTRVMRISRQPYPMQTMIGQKQLENVEYFNCLGSMITYDANCTREIKSRIAMAKAAFKKKNKKKKKQKKKKTLFTSKLDSKLGKVLVKYYICSMALYGAGT